MPTKRKGADLNRNTSKSRSLRNRRSERTEEQIQQQNTDARVRMAQLRQEESEDTRAERNEVIRLEQRQSRRFTVNRRRTNDQQRQQVHRAFTSDSFLRLAFHWDVMLEKVQLPEIETPSEPLNGLLIGTDPDSNVFLKSIRTFNSCLQMTSFGATEIVRNTNANGQQYNSTFKIRGQVYHKMGSLLPMPNEPHTFLQIYFMGGEDSGSALANRVNARCDYNNLDSFYARRIVSELDALLNEHNELLKIFKSHMHKLQSDNHAIVINPDKTPAGEHIRRFNAPVVDDVAGIMVGDRTGAREIVIRRRNNNLQFIADTHRSYDALQYPLIFWKGQDGYCINIKQRDPVSGAETNKNVSSKDYYAYRLMIRRGLDNVILRCRELCQQFMVNMYAKIEGERLRYIHLRDAINNNADVAEIGNHVILPSSYVSSPRHMQEYIRDALTFVREYGRP
ncbi:Helitron helicase-like domain, partial [Cinara cedri]